MSDYWFARRFPVGNPRNAMAPVTREGRMAFVWFALAMAVAGVFFVALAFSGMFVVGLVAFVAIAGIAAWQLIALVGKHGDQTRTVEDYRRMQSGSRT